MLEIIVHEESMEFPGKRNILYKYQSRFPKNLSADFCLSYLTDKTSKGFDSGLFTGVILIELQKTFDTIDHNNILLLKMPSLGFSREVLDWYKPYLSSRKFHVNVHDKFPTSADLRCEVSQGSIIRHLLVLLYINDMLGVVACTCNPATMEAEFRNGVGSIPVGGNSPSIDVWIV